MKKDISITLLIATLAACGHSSSAQTLAIDFGGDYSSGSINATKPIEQSTGDYNFDGNATDRAGSIPFGTEFSSPNSLNWTTPAGKSGSVIRYGISFANIDSAVDGAININRLVNNDAIDRIQATSGVNTAAMRMASAWYWEKSSFLNGFDTAGPLSFESAAGSLSAVIFNGGTPTSGNLRASRFLVRNGSDWYLSVDLMAQTGEQAFDINGADADWIAFDPTANLLFLDDDNLGATVSGATLNNITAVGIYAQHTLIDGTSINEARQGFASLQVSTIPELGSFALLLGVIGLGVAVAGRNRR